MQIHASIAMNMIDLCPARTVLYNKVAMNDFEEFAKAHSAVPEDEDEMFVVDVFTKAVREEGKIILLFRIFFSTVRLLSYTQHVSNQLSN